MYGRLLYGELLHGELLYGELLYTVNYCVGIYCMAVGELHYTMKCYIRCYDFQATYVVDNPATIFFTIFMALWATFFIEFWKRQQARIQYDWDVADYEEVEVRDVI